MKLNILIAFCIFCSLSSKGQALLQTIRGTIADQGSGLPVFGATVILDGTDPLIGTVSDINGEFRLEKVPLGRYDLKVSYMGYEPLVMTGLLVGSGKEVIINLAMKEVALQVQGVEISAATNKDKPLNRMAMVSARQLSVEESRRYGGSMDDPSRLAAAFAGVASNLSSNGITVRGNAPKGLLWNFEGVKIPNPNHFANLTVFGGGAFTALSTHMLDNSDFYTGAFPAEYSNAMSGVFDIRMRNGNNEKYEHAFQAGTIGLDVSSEGPFIMGKPHSYLFNYRYSTFALLEPFLPENAGGIRYQDLSFKTNIITPKGSLTIWGLGAMDKSGATAKTDNNSWEYASDKEEARNRSRLGAAGITYKRILGKKTMMNAILSASGNDILWEVDELGQDNQFYPRERVDNHNWNYALTTVINHKFSPRHTNRSGLILNHMTYNIQTKYSPGINEPLEDIVDSRGNSQLIQAFTQSQVTLSRSLLLNAGLHTQYYALTNSSTLEPRLGIQWNITPVMALSLAYGNHAQAEMPGLYLAEIQDNGSPVYPNLGLKMSRAHHIVLGYNLQLNEQSRITIEPYYQHLYHIPVIADSSFSLINLSQDWYINDPMVGSGTGWNAGIDYTYERFLNKGYYLLITGSFFRSHYTGGDDLDRSTRYDKGYVFNVLCGKEWKTGKAKNNLIGLNGRFTFQGGDRYSPVDMDASNQIRDVVYNENDAFAEQWPSTAQLHLTFNYTVNKNRRAGILSVQLINLLGAKEYYGHKYNLESNTVEVDQEVMMLPNISYKIEF